MTGDRIRRTRRRCTFERGQLARMWSGFAGEEFSPHPSGPNGETALEVEVLDYLDDIHEDVVRYSTKWRPLIEKEGLRPLGDLPYLYGEDDVLRLTRTSCLIKDAAQKVARSVCASDGAAGLSRLVFARLDESPETAHGLPAEVHVMRPDVLRTPAGYRVLELNMTPSVTGASHPFLVEYYAEHPFVRALSEVWDVRFPDYLEGLAGYFGKVIGGGKGVVLDFNHETAYPSDPETYRTVRFLKKYGLDLDVADFRDRRLEVNRKGVFFGGDRVSVVVCRFIPHFFYSKSGALQPLLRAWMDGLVQLIGQPGDLASCSKLLLAALLEPRFQGLLSAQELDAVRKAVPPTYRTVPSVVEHRGERIALADLLRLRKDDFVLKWGLGYGSETVHIGRFHDADAWSALTGKALSETNWVAQEFVAPEVRMSPTVVDGRMEPFLHSPVESPFIVEDRFFGIHVRAAGVLGPRFEGDSFGNGKWALGANIGAVLARKGGPAAVEGRPDASGRGDHHSG
ncbi:MAG: hypothetical protein WC969_06885 [Elusimicrobiota bacterium]|jgi:hypothetical protein